MTDNPYGAPPPDPYQPVPQTGPGQPAGGGYTFGPFAPTNGQAGGYAPPPGSSGSYPGAPPPGPPTRRRRTLVIVAITALALIILGVGSAIVVINLRKATATDPTAPGTSNVPTQTSAGPATEKPSDAVLAYLTALAAADAEKALSYGLAKPANASLLTDKVLASALKGAPLSAINVPPVDGQTTATVEASYQLGKKSVTESFDVVRQDEGWKLRRVAADIEFGLVRSGSVPLLVNGTKVSKDAVSVFPGSYTVSTGLKYVDYGTRSTIVVTGPGGFPNTSGLGLRVNGKGKTAAVAAAKKSYTSCLKSNDSSPSKCPNRWTSSAAKWRKGTVDWKQRGSDPFKKAKLLTSGTAAQVEIPLRVELSGTCTQGGRTGRCIGATITGTSIAVVSLASNSPKVRWL
jgi:hypothetical protein